MAKYRLVMAAPRPTAPPLSTGNLYGIMISPALSYGIMLFTRPGPEQERGNPDLTLKDQKPKKIIHLDMDAFYASVEVLDDPKLTGKPVIVGGRSRRGVVSAASYEAREFGVHSAQPMTTAMRLCPHGVFLPVRMWRYREISDQIFEIFRRFTPLVEPLSLDEAFLDVTGSTRLFGNPLEIAVTIKRLVREEIGLTVSAGVAPSKLVAKIASDFDKPDGLTVVPEAGVREFLDPLPVSRLWGVGRVTQKSLARLGVESIGDLGRLPAETLSRQFGDHGPALGLMAQGIDGREIEPRREAKSIGAEETYPEDIQDLDQARKELLRLTTRTARRMRQKGLVCQTVTLKVKYQDFKQITRSETLAGPTDEARTVFRTIGRLLEKTSVGHRPARLLGVSLSRLQRPGAEKQAFLFEAGDGDEKRRRLNQALDTISEKYGEKAILPATLVRDEA